MQLYLYHKNITCSRIFLYNKHYRQIYYILSNCKTYIFIVIIIKIICLNITIVVFFKRTFKTFGYTCSLMSNLRWFLPIIFITYLHFACKSIYILHNIMPNFKNVNFSVIERIIIKKYNINKSERNTPKYDLLILYIMTFKILQIFDL